MDGVIVKNSKGERIGFYENNVFIEDSLKIERVGDKLVAT
jgi:hypothetical protein